MMKLFVDYQRSVWFDRRENRRVSGSSNDDDVAAISRRLKQISGRYGRN
jgi:hypothetical protein